MAIHEFLNPIPAISPLGDCYIWYVVPSGNWENDVFTCVLKNGGEIKHFTSEQLNINKNATFSITEKKNNEAR